MKIRHPVQAGRPRAQRRATASVLAIGVASLTLLLSSTSAFAQAPAAGPPLDPAAIAAELSRLSAAIDAQEQRLADQERRLAQQAAEIDAQRAVIDRQNAALAAADTVDDADLGDMRAAGRFGAASDGLILLGQASAAQSVQTTPLPATPLPSAPVGQAPTNQEPPPLALALPEGAGVMTPAGAWVAEASVDYTRSSSNRLVFRGVEIITGVQVGVIEANDVGRDTVSMAASMRYGLTNRIEVEYRLPYVSRQDRVTTLAQRDSTISRTTEIDGADFGDLEFGARYQINAAQPGEPVFIAGLRVKSDSGRGPFELTRDEFGVAENLATGSGFWTVSPSIQLLLPSDPVVIYGGLSYGYSIEKDINRTIGGAGIRSVDPGDSIGANMGFGFSVNPRFSYSVGYSHTYIMPTKTEIDTTMQESTSLQIGSLSLGASYRMTPQATLSTSVDVGVTADAPDVRVSFRVPFAF